MSNDDNKIINLSSFRFEDNEVQLEEPITPEEYIEKGKEALQDALDNGGEAFFAVVFDAEGSPTLLWAGDIDAIKAIGGMRVTENLIIRAFYN